jgi:hypothetical protein
LVPSKKGGNSLSKALGLGGAHGPPSAAFDFRPSYRVQDPALLKAVKAGDKVKFDADRVNNQFTVTKIQKAK